MRSSTSVRIRPTSATSSSPARRLSGGRSSRCSRRIEASATSAASGVRSSWATSATKRRLRVSAVSRRPIVSARAAAIRLKRSAHVPNSSFEVTGTRADRSPRSIRSAARPAASTGARTPRAMTRATSRASEDEDDRPDDERRPQLGERLLERAHVVDEVEGRPAAAGAAADDEARTTGERDPGVGELAPIDAGPEVRRERRQDVGEVLARDDGPTGHVDDRVDAALEERLAQPAVEDVLGRRVGRQAAVRDRHRQVEAGLGGGVMEHLRVQAVVDEQVGPGAEQRRPSARRGRRA